VAGNSGDILSFLGSGYSKPLLGIQIPIVLGIGSLLLGIVLMAAARTTERDFFRRRPQSAAPDALMR
jgi:hypothetical protein